MIETMPAQLDNQIYRHVSECTANDRLLAIAVEESLDYENTIRSRDRETKQRLYREEEIRAEFAEIVGESPALKTTLDLVSVVAPTDSSVLILGETGTGKELIARAIHNLSGRRERAFVKFNCAAIPLGLLESELFGHEKGAFTGAIAQKTGRFELANKGTLFLDEVGDIPLELQAKLLRVLQEQEFERLGSNYTHKVDVRLIAATHRDLAAMVKQGTFREDLYYRLRVFPIHVPALRQRTEDIPKLVRHFIQVYARRMKKGIDEVPSETMDALLRYRWPGNVRELQNFIERAVILSPHAVLRAPISELEPFSAPRGFNAPMTGLEELERDHILRALEASNWVVGGRNGAAERLGMKRTSFVYKMRKFRISRPPPMPLKANCATTDSLLLAPQTRDDCHDERPSVADISHKSVSDDGQQAPPITDHFLLQLSGLARLLEPSGNFFVLASYLLPRAVAESREHYRVSAWATPLATTGGVGV